MLRTFEPTSPGSALCRVCACSENTHDSESHCPIQPPTCRHRDVQAQLIMAAVHELVMEVHNSTVASASCDHELGRVRPCIHRGGERRCTKALRNQLEAL